MFNKKLKNRIKELECSKYKLQRAVKHLLTCQHGLLGKITLERSGISEDVYLGDTFLGSITTGIFTSFRQVDRPDCLPKPFSSWAEYDMLIRQIDEYQDLITYEDPVIF